VRTEREFRINEANVTCSPVFEARGSKGDLEAGSRFQPAFDADGLIPAIVSDWKTGEVLMFAWMNDVALHKTIETGVAHFWSRSRGSLWQKGEESGNVLHVREMRTDCDQDVMLLRADLAGAGVACHTGARSCFYRKLEMPDDGSGPRLVFD
jgi:phosphoribosyl-AMP cyclohydrolase